MIQRTKRERNRRDIERSLDNIGGSGTIHPIKGRSKGKGRGKGKSKGKGKNIWGLDGEVDPGVAEDRRDELMALQEPITAELLAAQVGTRQRVLVCGRDEDGSWYGRTAGQAPDIDGVTLFADHDVPRLEQLRGTLAEVEITGSEGIDLFAELA